MRLCLYFQRETTGHSRTFDRSSFTAAHDWYSVGLIGYELFFNVRVLGSEEHRAKIIVQKLAGGLPTKKDLAKQCEDVTDVLGQNATEAIFLTLSRLMFDFTTRNLEFLRSAILKHFWTMPFIEGPEGEIVPGEPPRVPAYEVRRAPFGKLGFGIDGEWEDGFREYVKSNYWTWRTEDRDISRHGGRAL